MLMEHDWLRPKAQHLCPMGGEWSESEVFQRLFPPISPSALDTFSRARASQEVGPGLGPPSHRGPCSAAPPGWRGMKDLWTAGPGWWPPPEALKRLSCCTLKSWRPGRAVLNLAASETCMASIFLTGLWEKMWPTGRGLAARKYGESVKVYVGPFPLPSLTLSDRHT